MTVRCSLLSPSPTLTPHTLSFQVVNARHVTFTGRKMKDKQYYWHTLHPGGLKSRTPKELLEKDKAEEVGVFEHAVLRLLSRRLLLRGNHTNPPLPPT